MGIRRARKKPEAPGAERPRVSDGIAAFTRRPADRAVRLTRIGMIWEQAAQAFWPLAALLACVIAAFALGLVAMLPDSALRWGSGLVLLGAIVTAIRGGLRFRPVDRAAAINRVDAELPGRPLSALADRAAVGGEGALWRAHQAQMTARAELARAIPPDAQLARRDPFALRLAALVALVMALIFGGAAQMGQGIAAIAATISGPMVANDATIAGGPSWEGWAEPPAYTRRPTIYMNTLPEGDVLDLPKGSVVSFRLYGDDATLSQDIGPAQGDDPLAPSFRAEKSGAIRVTGRSFDINVLPDLAPVISAGAAPVRRADGRMLQDFEASDDHGVTTGQALIDLDLSSLPRRFGLAAEPEVRPAIELALPVPRSGDRRTIRGQIVEDLARHPWANLPVNVVLRAEDGIGQQGESSPMSTILPGRRFFDPLGSALIEVRRDLLWSRENAVRSAEILRALTWQPDGFVEPDLYGELRGAVAVLEKQALDEAARDRLAEALWEAAVELEDGGLADALERMKQAQERLSEAIRNGANPDEVQRLMDELKSATDDYTEMLAEQGQQDPAERFTRNQQGQQISGDQIQQMMDEIQRLMNEGRMAEAQQLLDQFNRMMENLQVRQSQGEGGEDSRSGQSMNRLADTLRDQQRLADDAFRELQQQFGQEGQDGDQLADRQQALREDLGQQRGLLPGRGSESGDEAGRQLDDAGRAMEDAERALRQGDMGEAMQRQADAIQSMREGMRSIGDMLDQERRGNTQDQGQGQQPGQQQDSNGAAQAGGQGMPYDGRPILDPLGREQAGNGNVIGGGDPLAEGADPSRRARDLLDEIRRRSGERHRPQDERDYMGRLLERF